MNAELHQRVKELFSELCELTPSEQERRLTELESESTELVRELRSLLPFHTRHSTVIPSPPTAVPKVRTRSTLSKTYQSRWSQWLRFFLQALAIPVPVLLAGIALSYWTSNHIQTVLKNGVAQRLNDRIDQRLAEFYRWESGQLAAAKQWEQQVDVAQTIKQLLESLAAATNDESHSDDSQSRLQILTQSQVAKRLSEQLRAWVGDRADYSLWDRRMVTLADSDPTDNETEIGDYISPTGAALIAPVLRGQSLLYVPRLRSAIELSKSDQVREFSLSLLVPIEDKLGNVMAVLRISGAALEQSYLELTAQWTKSQLGETYLLSERGAMLTSSRYLEAIDKIDLPTVGAGQHGLLLVRNPGVNLLAGEIPETIPSAWPPTLLAQQVTSGNNGISVEGYRNYVGQWVVGAWRWMPDHEIGLALEEHADDAFASVAQIKRAIGGLTALFVLSTAGVSMFSLVKLSRSRMRELSDVGAYQVQELLGEGGMGRVYLAEHALLCRQSAVKVLNGNVVDHSVISRFEREVQLASQLTHPNTIAIYDFGRNKEGLFYYAMEYINGAHLGQLVEYSGPLHPGRCIYVLRQLCRALGEAHQVGVVHRDIKPQNIMVCNRGGEPDFVKLFDYGLVKAFAPGVSPTFSQTKIVVGTPRFMAPERLSSPWLADPRVDIYSVGALAYFLLTSKLPPLFTSIGSGASDQPGVETLDLPAGVVEFGELLGMCLSTEPADRPSSMKALLDALELLAERFPWSREDSVVWWSKHEAKLLQLVKSKRKKLVAQLAR